MLFFTLNGANVDFLKRKLWWKSYTIEKALLTTKRVELVEKKKFAAAALDPGHKIFIVYVAFLNNPNQEGNIHHSCRAQIAALIANEALTLIPTEHSDFANIFSLKLTSELPKHTGINDHAIELDDNQQPSYRPIYRLGLVELEMLKTYIKTNLANGFIRLSKSPVEAPIFFNKKPNKSFQLCVDYWGLNNLTIKNIYLLPLVRESLNWLGQAWRFTQLDLTNVYYRMRICKKNK